MLPHFMTCAGQEIIFENTFTPHGHTTSSSECHYISVPCRFISGLMFMCQPEKIIYTSVYGGNQDFGDL